MTIDGSKGADAQTRIRLGMVGGGQGAFIGAVHRIAARMDDAYELVAGALSSDPDRAKASGAQLGLDPRRSYADYAEMAKRERRLKDGIEAVSIVTPNHMHFPVARTFVKAGVHVICDKPLVTTSREARELARLVEKAGTIFAVTYNYSGYPMVRQAREMVASGDLGAIRVVQVEYSQDWLTESLEATGQKQAAWRTDPAKSGAGGAVGDIGTHAYQLACFVSGLTPSELCADLSSFGAGRVLDDNVHVLLRFEGGARGMLWASQVAPGNENALKLRVYGERGGLEWCQEEPNRLWYTPFGEPKRLITRGGSGSAPVAARVTRVPPGHPEGYLEGFANIYSEVARAIRARRTGAAADPDVTFPTITDGAAGVAFIEAAVTSSQRGGRWVGL
ncbi:Gfo/Idh/MocA family oxidoreductase [Microbaculum marinum]|uniref:Gfo/Idh/MocA family oxidoreductase n=1 Tax=Microbaculum marinum TaxID=1764581 RepID=A0AAW9RA96_9HYPH